MNEDQPTSQVAIAGPAPIGVSGGSASPGVGCVGGGQTVFYYVIARFPSGLAFPPTGAIVARNTAGIGNLSNVNFNVISWPAVSGATGYDVVRRRTQQGLNNPCTACAVVLNTQATSVNDTGQNGGDYPPAGFAAAQDVTAILQVDNTTAAAPFVTVRMGSNAPLRGALIKTFTPGSGAAYDSNGNLVNAAASSGTVTSITGVAPLTLTPNPITGVGTAAIDTTVVAQKFFGSGAPGSVAGNLPGDTYIDTVSHAEYYCAAAPGTGAPACTAVGVGNWTKSAGLTSITGTAPLILTPNPITGVGTAAIDTTVVAQKFFGAGAPGSVAGNLPGDTYIDSVSHAEYFCAAAAGTAAPACTAVGVGNWTIAGTPVSAADPYVTVSGAAFGPVYALSVPPAVGTLVFVNSAPGTGTAISLASGAIVMTAPANGGNSIKFLHPAAYPATPYTFTIGMVVNFPNFDFFSCGLAISDGTKFAIFGLGRDFGTIGGSGVGQISYTLTSGTSGGSAVTSLSQITGNLWFMSIQDDGTNITLRGGPSPDNMTLFFTTTRGALGITPTQVGIYINDANASFSMSVLFPHWTGI